MKTLILHHDDCMKHDPGRRHAEQAARVTAVLAAVKSLPGTELLPAPLAEREQITRVHPAEYRDWLTAMEPPGTPGAEATVLDPDTRMSAGSFAAASRASGAACFAVDEVIAGRARNAFCATRPPGHHAEASRAMGFCLLNHVAVAARHACAAHGMKRVAIVDFDVHHGNGTQAIFENDPGVLFISSHQMPLYPGSGRSDETGCGNVVNLPLPPGAGSAEFRRVWSATGLPRLKRFKPAFILVSAGFDAHARDPLGQLELEDADYGWITSEIRTIAEACCEGRLVSVLEGGYDLEALASASMAHVTALTA